MQAKLTHIEQPNDVTRLISVETDSDVGFIGGQYIEASVGGSGASRFAPVSSDSEQRKLRFAIKRAGDVSQKLFDLQVGDTIELSVPRGDCVPPERGLATDIVMIVTDSAICTALGLMNSGRLEALVEKVHLVWCLGEDDTFLGDDMVKSLFPRTPALFHPIRRKGIGAENRLEDYWEYIGDPIKEVPFHSVFLAGDRVIVEPCRDKVLELNIAPEQVFLQVYKGLA